MVRTEAEARLLAREAATLAVGVAIEATGGILEGGMRADSARAVTLGSFWDGFMMSPSNVSYWGIPPDNLYEYQKKRLTKFAFHKCVILKGMSFASKTGNNGA